MEKQLLLGDEAFAQGAIDAGVSGAYGYPGTPSTEIIMYFQKNADAIKKNIHRAWSCNEKTAMETALGMSYAGKRAIVTMKHVGLNVAADGFVNSALTGANGGLLVAVGDDPAMHSSQCEQDSRFYAKFALLPILEPTNQQEAYDMAFYGFDLSEKFELPVMVRFTTRLAHSRAGVERREKQLEEGKISLPEDKTRFVLLPLIARKRYKLLIEKQVALEEMSENSPYNVYQDGKDKNMGIMACGLTYNYLMENYPDGCPYPVLKISQYPLPKKKVQRLFSECESVLVLEEGQPLVEEQLRGFLDNGKLIKGKLDGTLPRDGELNPDHVAVALGIKQEQGLNVPSSIVPRPPAFCLGCPHSDSFNALKVIIEKYGKGHVFSDIGCYTMGVLPPYNAIDTCVCMGAAITLAKGAADAGLFPSIAVIGDSTFSHSGITGLLDSVNEKTNMVIIILDNETTAMTGGQASSGFGKLEEICKSMGVDPEHIRVCNPLKRNHDELVRIYQEEIDYEGLSVIIPRRECVQTMTRRNKSLMKSTSQSE